MAEEKDYQEPEWGDVNRDVLRSMLVTTPKYWWLLGTTMTIAVVCFFAPWLYQWHVGVGAAGMNRNAVCGTYLSSFIF